MAARRPMNHNEIASLVRCLEKANVPDHAPISMNVALRDHIQHFATSHGLDVQQDNLGNLYMTRPGTDPGLPPIGLTFRLDDASSGPSLQGALETLRALQHEATACGICLVGWSSPQGSNIGNEVWSGTLAAEDAREQFEAIRSFSDLEPVEAFSFSALYGILVDNNPSIACQGSPVLFERLRKSCGSSAGESSAEMIKGGPISKRVPVLVVRGRTAVAVASKAIVGYSEYVVGLFDNFD